jgi:formate dehydrogenase alpha subunit
MIKLTINGQEIETKAGATVMEAALEHGIDIPHLCYHPELPVSGGCRMCMVEVGERPFPVASCGLLAEDGMDIRTQSEQLTEMRHDIIDLFVADHPLDCVTCDKAGACDLQKYAYEYGVTNTSHQFDLSRTLYQDDNPFFIRDHQYCILCSKCVRVCSDVVGANAIEIVGRGFESHVATPFDGPMINSDCVFCGSCVQICPTAALLPVARLGKGREWELERAQSVCGYCGVGCNVEFAMKDGEILYVEGSGDNPVNGELLCTKGRYGWDFATNPDRLTSPMLRRDVAYDLGLIDEPWELPEKSVLAVRRPKLDDTHVPVDWDTALDLVAEKFADTVQAYGPDSIMGLCSARCTNEDNYLLQKFFRASIKTNNIDHCARL